MGGVVGGKQIGKYLAKKQKEGKSVTIPKTNVSYPQALSGAVALYGVLGVDDDENINQAAAIVGTAGLAAEAGVNGYLEEMAAPPPAPAGG